jgi:hypothetical protein
MQHSIRPLFFTAVLFTAALFSFLPSVFCYTTYQNTEGALKLYFGEPKQPLKVLPVSELNKPYSAKVVFENSSDKPLSLKLKFRTIETIEFVVSNTLEKDSISRTLEVPAKGTQTTDVQFIAKEGTYSAHYPIHLDVEFSDGSGVGNETKKTNICLVLETTIPDAGTPKNPLLGKLITDPKHLPLNTVPEYGGLYFPPLDTYRGVWNYDNKPLELLPTGYNTSSSETGGHIGRHNNNCGGIYRQGWTMHPPYRGSAGNIGVEYRTVLPKTTPLTLTFFSAVRGVVPPETPSDGVVFRVLVDGKNVYEKLNAKTEWVENTVDLSSFAGKEFLLRFESDPGPKRNTNCDSCFWGDILLFAGSRPAILSAEQKQSLAKENREAIKSGKTATAKTQVFHLDGGLNAAVTFGNNGFIDGVIGVGNSEKQVQFDGLKVWCRNQPVGDFPSSISTGQWVSKNTQNAGSPPRPATKRQSSNNKGGNNENVNDKNQWAQDVNINGENASLFFTLLQKGPAVQFSVDSSDIDLISRIEFGTATEHADRVYYGHGYCIEQPESFTADGGGHNLSTSHVGMDFANGISVLQASSFPVDRFVVAPERKLYTLSVHPATTITLLPGLSGALDCAVRFRPISGKVAASGFETKNGRFVFDVWGGKYKEHTETLQNAVKYGLTDAQFIVHNWQRWGYDNVLPDIFPPNPKMGTLEDMQESLKYADKHGIQYGIHDNYIDFYPDAEEYNFDVTTFSESGQPRKAWNNYGIDAQSYQFRPDKIPHFLNRNLDLLTKNLPVSTYFIDVFTSAQPFDYYDRDGKFHSRAETWQNWAQTFDTVRTRLSKANPHFASATASSEAGMDSLIGHLDGADCQFMFLSEESGEFRIKINCKQWSRVPWFDAVHHNVFSQHGVGYSGRYEAQRGRVLHGIDSDDYIVSEILTGHSLMTDWSSAKRGAVRKYWLAQDLIRHLADKHIVKVEFVDNNIQREIITWNDGTKIYINTGTGDWDIRENERETAIPVLKKAVLPQYGYFAYGKNFYSGIVRLDGKIVDAASTTAAGKTAGFVNARQHSNRNVVPVLPKVKESKYLAENKIQVSFDWKTQGKIDKDWCIFVHCVEKRKNRHHKPNEAFLSGGGYPQVPSSQWKGTVNTGNYTIVVPDDLPAGKYYLVTGLYDSKGDGHRAHLLGIDTGGDRYAVAWLKVERGKDGKVSNLSAEPLQWEDETLSERLLPSNKPADFDFVKTAGAFRIESDSKAGTHKVIPLPDEPVTEVSLAVQAKSVKAVDADGKELRDVPFKQDGRYSVFTTQKDEFAYILKTL